MQGIKDSGEYFNMANFITRVILFLLLVGCTLDMPYGYFTLVRLCSFVGFANLSYQDFENKRFAVGIFDIVCAILFNPLIKITFKRSEWFYIDLIVASFLLVYTIYILIKISLGKEKAI